MEETRFISICIPAFQRTGHLKRLLDSIDMQTFRHFEVIITDDSPGGEVGELVKNHPLYPMIRYFKNTNTLGTPENWNEGLRMARADWIKIMHDDDWFSGADSLRYFAEAIERGTDRFYFSAFTNVFPDGHSKIIKIKKGELKILKRIPENLLSANRIGPPSAVIFKRDHSIVFDKRMKWLVDIDFYIRYLKKHPAAGYIYKNLVRIGISDSQVTHSSFGNPHIEIPERFMLAEKLDSDTSRNIRVFDSWWRFLRNLSIRDIAQIEKAGYKGEIPLFITAMIKNQRNIPGMLLKRGIISKFFMLIHYLKSKKNRTRKPER
jgi:glycosyltransferase involved in cell wall biosynthesis